MTFALIGARAVVLTVLLASTAAQATYFIRPGYRVGGELVDGYVPNGPTSGTQSFNDGFRSVSGSADLATGEIKAFGQLFGYDPFGVVGFGVMGERIRYTGPSDAPVNFTFDYDGFIEGFQFDLVDASIEDRYIGLEAYFAVYNAGDADYLEWTHLSVNASKALYVDFDLPQYSFSDISFGETVFGQLSTDLNLINGQSYDVYAAFNVVLRTGFDDEFITMDFNNTSTIGIQAPIGGSFTSSSGEFLGFELTPSSVVPEPASWAMLIAGFGLTGAALRRRRLLATA